MQQFRLAGKTILGSESKGYWALGDRKNELSFIKELSYKVRNVTMNKRLSDTERDSAIASLSLIEFATQAGDQIVQRVFQ
jgi:hypothetical protein